MTEIGAEIKTLQTQLADAVGNEQTQLNEQIAALEQESADKKLESLRNIRWKPLWGIPAAFAGVIMVMFAALFHDKGNGDEKKKAEPDATAEDQHVGDGSPRP